MNSHFFIQNSFYYSILLFLLAIGAIVCVFCTTFPIALQIICVIVIIGYTIFVWKRDAAGKSQQCIIHISRLENLHWQLKLRNNTVHDVLLQRSSVVTRYFAVLHFREISGKKFHGLFLLPDQFSADAWRDLRIQLKW